MAVTVEYLCRKWFTTGVANPEDYVKVDLESSLEHPKTTHTGWNQLCTMHALLDYKRKPHKSQYNDIAHQKIPISYHPYSITPQTQLLNSLVLPQRAVCWAVQLHHLRPESIMIPALSETTNGTGWAMWHKISMRLPIGMFMNLARPDPK